VEQASVTAILRPTRVSDSEDFVTMMWFRPRRSWYNTTTPQSSSLHRGGGGFMRTQTKSITKSGRPGVIAPAPSPDGPSPERREAEEDVVLDDLLVEDVSIDGMCGVY
jgi:mycofactocin precursor